LFAPYGAPTERTDAVKEPVGAALAANFSADRLFAPYGAPTK